jgi:hypothetical protein
MSHVSRRAPSAQYKRINGNTAQDSKSTFCITLQQSLSFSLRLHSVCITGSLQHNTQMARSKRCIDLPLWVSDIALIKLYMHACVIIDFIFPTEYLITYSYLDLPSFQEAVCVALSRDSISICLAFHAKMDMDVLYIYSVRSALFFWGICSISSWVSKTH